jgi:hypothetical protein
MENNKPKRPRITRPKKVSDPAKKVNETVAKGNSGKPLTTDENVSSHINIVESHRI